MKNNINKKRWLIITIEIVSRELAGKLIIANEAIKKGWGVIFGGRRELLKNMKYLPKGVFFVKSAMEIDRPYIYAAKRYGQKVVCHDAEGLVQHNYDYFVETRIKEEVLDLIDLYFTWGEKQENEIINKYPKTTQKIKAVGNPIIELWNGRYQHYDNGTLNKLANKYGKYIAIPTSFGEYNHILGSDIGLNMEINSYGLKGKYLQKKFLLD